jgi:hypothetical protein
MRQLTVTARQYEYFLFPYVAGMSADSVDDFETQLRLMRKLKDPALTVEIPLTEEEEEAARRARVSTYSSRRLLEDQATFMLDEDEWKMAKKRVEAHRTKCTGIAAEDVAELIEVITMAQKIEVKPETAES